MTQEQMQYIQEDKIDLKELWQILVKRKILILILTVIMTLLATIYVVTAKPVYSGKVLLEIGKIANEQFNDGEYSSLAIVSLDNVNNLKSIVTQMTSVSASIPKKTDLLTLSTTGFDKAVIQEKLEKATAFILERHKENASLRSGKNAKVQMTRVIGQIDVGQDAVKPKKKLIVIIAFITGLMLSIFLTFFLEFIQGNREEEEKEAPQDSLS